MSSSDEHEIHLVENVWASSSVEDENIESSESEDSDAADLNALKYEIGSFVDSRDKQTYRTVTIGNQIWMKQNLNYVNLDNRNTNNYSFCYANDTFNLVTTFVKSVAKSQ
jgi:hypothetical protein